MIRPKVFIASSKEAEPIAKAIQLNLDDVALVTVWSQAFLLGENVIDGIVRNLASSDFGIFVFAPDDTVKIHGNDYAAVRDNVILELGAFIGRLGKMRSFIICPEGVPLRLPSDLYGVIFAHYKVEDVEANITVALSAACTEVSMAIARQLEESENQLKSQEDERLRKLNELVENALEAVCRAMSIPIAPHEAKLRVFVFRKEQDELVCRHFWGPYRADEEVGKTKFTIDPETGKRVVVVKCYLDDATQRNDDSEFEGNDVTPLPEDFKGMKGSITRDIEYVLAAPIRNADGSVWGVVDFDASNADGIKLLKYDNSRFVITRLACHLGYVLK